MTSIKAELLSRSKQLEPVEVEEGLSVHVRRLSVRDVVEIQAIDDKTQGTYELVVRGIREADGAAVFHSHDEVAELDWQLVKRLSELVAQVNKLTETEEKNSPPTPASS